MARIGLVLGTLARITVRELRHLNAIIGNNFFIFTLIFLSQSGVFLQLLMGLLLLFPLTANPLERIPAVRMALWPLSGRERVGVRLVSYLLSPALVVTLAGLVVTQGSGTALRFLAVVVGFTVVTALVKGVRWGTPRLFPGEVGMVGATVRQLVTMLDFYLAVVVAAVVVAYRFGAREVNESALFVMSLMVVLAMSTAMQCAFARELPGGWTRYALWPVRGWRVLLAKDLGLIVLLVPLVVWLKPVTALAAALAALAIGHHRSVTVPHAQTKWRFYAGTLVPHGLLQTVAIFGVGTMVERGAWWWMVPLVVVGWAGSLGLFGLVLEWRLRDD